MFDDNPVTAHHHAPSYSPFTSLLVPTTAHKAPIGVEECHFAGHTPKIRRDFADDNGNDDTNTLDNMVKTSKDQALVSRLWTVDDLDNNNNNDDDNDEDGGAASPFIQQAAVPSHRANGDTSTSPSIGLPSSLLLQSTPFIASSTQEFKQNYHDISMHINNLPTTTTPTTLEYADIYKDKTITQVREEVDNEDVDIDIDIDMDTPTEHVHIHTRQHSHTSHSEKKYEYAAADKKVVRVIKMYENPLSTLHSTLKNNDNDNNDNDDNDADNDADNDDEVNLQFEIEKKEKEIQRLKTEIGIHINTYIYTHTHTYIYIYIYIYIHTYTYIYNTYTNI